VDLLYFWRGENYRHDIGSGQSVSTLAQSSAGLHAAEVGDTVWAFTRNRQGRYVLAAEAVVAGKDTAGNPDGYGQYRILIDPQQSRFFDTKAGEDIEPLIRSIGVRAQAKTLGRAFQGPAAVRPLSPDASSAIAAFAEALRQMSSTGGTVARAWSDGENQILVSGYLDKLDLEIRGESFNKAEFNRLLRERLAERSRGAIEYKLQNVSGVLEALRRPWISGYKPARNYQEALVDAIASALEQDRPEPSPGRLPPVESVEFSPVPVPPREPAQDPRLRRAAKIDFAARDARNRTLGMTGEKFVIAFEKARLIASKCPDLADRVTWVSRDQGDGLGYDIGSFEPDGRTICIEVKTSNGSNSTPFLLSAAEVAASRDLGSAYRLYRVYSFCRRPEVYRLYGPLDRCCRLEPTVYRAFADDGSGTDDSLRLAPSPGARQVPSWLCWFRPGAWPEHKQTHQYAA
jgi:hypothetical protein